MLVIELPQSVASTQELMLALMGVQGRFSPSREALYGAISLRNLNELMDAVRLEPTTHRLCGGWLGP